MFITDILGFFVSLLTRELSLETGLARLTPCWAPAGESADGPSVSTSVDAVLEAAVDGVMMGAESRRLFLKR